MRLNLVTNIFAAELKNILMYSSEDLERFYFSYEMETLQVVYR